MKYLYLFLPILLMHSFSFSQNYVIINNPVQGGFELPLQDTLILSHDDVGCLDGIVYYYVDLDNDDNSDVQFILSCYMGGEGAESWIRVSSFGDFQTVLNTDYQANAQYIGNDGLVHDTVYTYTVVKKYMDGDTICTDEPSWVEPTIIAAFDEGYDPEAIYMNIDQFIGDTAYMAFYKLDGNNTWIYYMNVYIPSFTEINLISAYANDQVLSIVEPKNGKSYISPNPVVDKITIAGNFDHMDLYSLQGILLISQEISGNNRVDISSLPKGLYFAKLKSNKTEIVQKIMKQ